MKKYYHLINIKKKENNEHSLVCGDIKVPKKDDENEVQIVSKIDI